MAINSMATLDDLLNLLDIELQSDSFFTTDMKKDYLNQAYIAVCKLKHLGVTTDTSDASVDGTQEYDWPTDAMVITGVKYDDNVLRKESMRSVLARGTSLSSSDRKGIVERYYLTKNRKIGLWRIPNETGETITKYYIKFPTLLNETTDIPIIKRDLYMAVVYRAAQLGYITSKEFSLAKTYDGLFKEEMAEDSILTEEEEPDFIDCMDDDDNTG